MAKDWKNVRIEAGLHEDLQCEIARLMEAHAAGVPIAVEPTESQQPNHAGITMSDFVRRLLTVYQRERTRKERSAAKKRQAKRKGNT